MTEATMRAESTDSSTTDKTMIIKEERNKHNEALNNSEEGRNGRR